MDKKILERLSATEGDLQDWYQSSIDQNDEPVWTDKHIHEVVFDNYVIPKRWVNDTEDEVTDFERGQWSVIQNVIAFIKDYHTAAQLCREAGIGYKKIELLQKDCGYSFKDEVNDFLKESKSGGTYLKLER